MSPASPDDPGRPSASSVDETANVTTLRIRASAQDGVVVFTFFHPSGRPCGPAWIAVEEADSKRALWSLEAEQPSSENERAAIGSSAGSWTGLRAFRYGVVPSGYRQLVPGDGPPESLQAGMTYRVSAYGNRFGAHLFTI